MKFNNLPSLELRNKTGRLLAIALAALVLGPMVLGPSIATAQLTEGQIPGFGGGGGGDPGGGGGDPGGGGGGAPAGGGVEINPDGVLSLRAIPQNGQMLNRQRAAAAKASLNRDLATRSNMRKVSLNRLEAEIKKLKDAGQAIPMDMQYLAGMTRITHVFYYPETKDIVIAGPAEGFFRSAGNRVLGADTGAATLALEDLVVALRAFGPDGNTRVIACSIDPTQQGLATLKKAIPDVFANWKRGNVNDFQVAQAFQAALGMQTITVDGISPSTNFARVIIEADYQMKLIGIGLADTPVGIVRFIDRATASDGGDSLKRWYFQPNYDCVHVNQDETAMQLVGSGVKLVGANESIANDGARAASKKVSRASQNYCTSFTKKYDRLAEQVPLFAELRNCVDLSIAAAFIQKMDFYGQAEWGMELFGSEKDFPVERFNAPTQVPSAVNAVRKGGAFMTPIGGGVHIQAHQAIESDNLVVDEKGVIDEAKVDDKIGKLTEGQWWWD